jgi:TfoX/Sxy family transcriptional regulator of competence genes
MAYDSQLADRIAAHLNTRPGYSAKRMFGGVGYLCHGNMAAGVSGEALIVRVGPAEWHAALTAPGAREFDITGRSMTGWVMVDREGWDDAELLADWLERGWRFAATLPAKG